MTRRIMRAVISRREVKTETGRYFIETLSCKHQQPAFPEAQKADAKRRSCHQCLKETQTEVAYLSRLQTTKKPSKPDTEQCARCGNPAVWPWKLCKVHLTQMRAARSRKRRGL